MECLEEAITSLFRQGFKHDEILLFLLNQGFNLSKSSLKRQLRRLNLYRRKNYTPLDNVVAFLESQLVLSSRLHGYRWMHLKCLHSGITIKQETIRLLMSITDPHGVSLRRKRKLDRRHYFNKGPNYLWHMDGYDKLKPYGICISGCIDGYSRKILWLRASHTNNNPKVIAGYYVNTVGKLNGVPRTLRSDFGTENSYVEDIQIYLYEANVSGTGNNNRLPPFLYGTSHNNQRIESWWSILRKHNTQYWMNIFSQLRNEGLFTGNFMDKSIVQYCFMDIIQDELDDVVREWNTHLIRKNRHSLCPSGRPDVMYNFPELYASKNYQVKVQEQDLQNCQEECVFLDCPCADRDIYDLCGILSAELNINKPHDPIDAFSQYVQLRNEIIALL